MKSLTRRTAVKCGVPAGVLLAQREKKMESREVLGETVSEKCMDITKKMSKAADPSPFLPL